MRLVVLMLALLVSATAQAADDKPVHNPHPPIMDVPPGDDVIVVAEKGKPAPISGQLFSQETALRWANWIDQYRQRLVLDVAYEKEVCRVELEHRDTLVGIEQTRADALGIDLNKRLVRSEQRNADLQDSINNPSFWRSMEFGIILGAVVTAAGVVSIGLAAN